MKLALLQLVPCGDDVAANLEKGERACREAARLGSDVALFPEMWSIGYTYNGQRPGGDLLRHPSRWQPGSGDDPAAWAEDAERWRSLAVPKDGAFVEHFRGLARELGMAIAITYLRRHEGGLGNAVTLFNAAGAEVLTYDKVHTCCFDLPEALLTPGDGFRVGTLRTATEEVEAGAMICFDREFPESARCLALMGAELILTPNACPLTDHRLSQFRVRALENAVAVAMANYAAPTNNGHSVVYDPIGFAHEQPRDNLVLEAGDREGIYVAELDFTKYREYRERGGWSTPFRRPEAYGALLGPAPAAFERVDREGRAAW
jgi:predicted amidohydrolase